MHNKQEKERRIRHTSEEEGVMPFFKRFYLFIRDRERERQREREAEAQAEGEAGSMQGA